MEFVRDGALNSLLQKGKSGLYPNAFIQYAKQIADGMKYLRDEFSFYDQLKIFIMIVGFYITHSNTSAAGTFPWMSSECIRSNAFSTKCNVRSFCVLLRECITGEIPYRGFDRMQVLFGIATNKYSSRIPTACPENASQFMKVGNNFHIIDQHIEIRDRERVMLELTFAQNDQRLELEK
ncbi:unnamed protein product [Rotaria magnacalcarata]|uniref:Serine-threonine/tyrosine-protein kinase catalytic domain-containing protein n=2 Tax=Rotaria magnacalcarata TaxID=392030 RepID=A0A819W8Y8_9BILA|nr:unnamed protein product [Rotaria magnacalcarata]CAF4270720.1 unnamed protein product [Rotaria magnacalcarata]